MGVYVRATNVVLNLATREGIVGTDGLAGVDRTSNRLSADQRAYMESMAQPDEKIPPAVKAWLDNVIVPAMVRRWIAEAQQAQGI